MLVIKCFTADIYGTFSVVSFWFIQCMYEAYFYVILVQMTYDRY